MKKITLYWSIILFQVCSSNTLLSQSEIERLLFPRREWMSSYPSSYTKERFSIRISYNKSNEFRLWIDAHGLDEPQRQGGFYIQEKYHAKFIETLKKAKAKYIEWRQVAIDNNISDYTKLMDFDLNITGYFRYANRWHVDFIPEPSIVFSIVPGNPSTHKYLLLIKTNKLTSYDDEKIESDGFLLVFRSASGISEFIDTISLESIKSFQSKPSKEDLFK